MNNKSIVGSFISTLLVVTTVLITIFGIIIISDFHGEYYEETDTHQNNNDGIVDFIHNSLKKLDDKVYQVLEYDVNHAKDYVDAMLKDENLTNPSLTKFDIIERVINASSLSKHNKFFLISEDGNIQVDQSDLFSGNSSEVMDEEGMAMFIDMTFGEKTHAYKVNSKWLKDGVIEAYYSIVIPSTEQDYFIGINVLQDDLDSKLQEMVITQLDHIKSKVSNYKYAIYNYSGELVINATNDFPSFEMDKIKEVLENNTMGNGQIQNGASYDYAIIQDLEWIVFTSDDDVEMTGRFSRNDGIDYTFLFLHVVAFVLFLILIFIVIHKISKRITNKINHEINGISYAVSHDEVVDVEKLDYQEIKQIALLVNKSIREQHVKSVPTASIVQKTPFNELYVTQYLINTLFPANINQNAETFNVFTSIGASLKDVMFEHAGFELDLLCAEKLVMTQNHEFFNSLIKFFVVMILLNSEVVEHNIMTIEVINDDEEVNIAISRNVTHSSGLKIEDELLLFDDLRLLTHKYLNGELNLSTYTSADSKVIIRCPVNG